jgi:hypothetical protein
MAKNRSAVSWGRSLGFVIALGATLCWGGAVSAQPGDDDDEPAGSASAAPEGSAPPAEEKPPEKKEGDEKDGDKKDADDDVDPNERNPRTVKLGVNVQRVAKVDLAGGSFEADMIISYDCSKEPCKPKIELYGGEIKGKPEMIVDGKLNKVMRVKAEIAADIDLTSFPFDHHDLEIDIIDKDVQDVTFEISAPDTPEPTDVKIPGWDVIDGEATIATEDLGDDGKISHFVYTVEIARPSVAAFAKNFLPALIMVFVLIISLIMKPKMAKERLAAGTGTFVALIMFHNNVAGQLPPLSFLTLLDKFMFTLYLMWITHIAISIGIFRAEDAGQKEQGEKLYKIAFFVVPAIAVISWPLVFLKIL